VIWLFRRLLLWWLYGHRQREVVVTATFRGFSAKGGDGMAYTLPSDMYVTLRVDYVDAHNHPALVDGDVTWSSSAPGVADVEVDPADSQQCKIIAGATLGTAQITATADADLGAGVRNISTIMDVTVVAGEAVAGVISPVGEAQPI
jgi:hypothetical protein